MTRVHSRGVRAAVFAMSGGRCVYCGAQLDKAERAQDLAIDHVVPISHGGSNAITNLVASCMACNGKKSDQTLLAFLMGTSSRLPAPPPPAVLESLGARLRWARDRKLWRQDELAEKARVPVVTISRIENDHHKARPYQSTIKKLASALDVNAVWLMTGENGE